MICDLSTKPKLKAALEEHVNVLVKKGLAGTFDYKSIIRNVYELAYAKNQDQAQSLGLAYHVPVIMSKLFKANKTIPLTNDVLVYVKEINTLIEKLNEPDPLNTIGIEIDVIKLTSAQKTQLSLAEQAKTGAIIIVNKTTSTGFDFVDRMLLPLGYLKTTGVQNKEVLISPDSKKRKKVDNETNPDKNFYYDVHNNLMTAGKGALDFSNVEYSGHVGFRLRALTENSLPNIEKNLYPNKNPSDYTILALTDMDGNFLYFKEDQSIGNENDGKIVYFFLDTYSEAKTKDKKNLILDRALQEATIELNNNKTLTAEQKEEKFKNLEKELKKEIDKKIDEQIEVINDIVNNVKGGKNTLLDITGGKKGSWDSTDLDQFKNRKREVEKPVNKTNITDKEKNSVKFTAIKVNKVVQEYPSIMLNTSDEPIPLKNPNKIGAIVKVIDKVTGKVTAKVKDKGLLDNIVTMLVDDVTLLGKKLTGKEKMTYVSQFLYLGNIVDSKTKNKLVIIENQASPSGLSIQIGNKTLDLTDKENSKNELTALLGNNAYVSFMKSLYYKGDYTSYQIQNGEVTNPNPEDNTKNYNDFIFDRMVAKVPIDITTNRPMTVNGYFTYAPADADKIVTKSVKATLDKVKPNQPDIKSLTEGWNNLDRTKSIAANATAGEILAGDIWAKKAGILKAKDKYGNKIISLKHLKNIVNSDAFATFVDAGITLYADANSTHLYHEAWHAFSQVYLSVSERDQLYSDIANQEGSFKVIRRVSGPGTTNSEVVTVKFKDAERVELEEYIAEEFRKYAMRGGKFNVEPSNVISKFFDRIWKLLKQLFQGVSDSNLYSTPRSSKVLSDMFDVLYTAEEQEDGGIKGANNSNIYMPSIDNAEFGTLNAGIIEAELSLSDSLLLSRSMDGIISEITTELTRAGKYGAITNLMKGESNLNRLYNVVIKDKLNQRLTTLQKEKEEKESTWTDAQKTNKNNVIRILSSAVKEENYGSISDIINAKSSKNSLVAFHRENSDYKDMIREDLDPTELDITDKGFASLSRRMDDKSGVAVDPDTLADNVVLYLIKSLLKQNKNGDYKINKLGFPETIEFKPFYNLLLRKVAGKKSPKGLYNNILKASESNISPLFSQLLSKIGDPEEVMSTSDSGGQVWLGLVQAFNLQSQALIANSFSIKKNKKGDLELQAKTGKSSAAYFKIKNQIWPAEFKTKSSIYINKNAKREAYINLDEVKKKFLTEEKDNKGDILYVVQPNDKIKFLNSIGLYLDNTEEIKNNLEDDVVKYIAQSIGRAALNKQEITDIVEFLDLDFRQYKAEKYVNDKKVTYFKPLENVTGRVNQVAQLQADFSDENAGVMALGADGSLQGVFSLNSTISQKVTALNDVEQKGELFDRSGEYKHMSYLDPSINPNSKGIIIYNSMFNTKGQKKANAGIQIFNATGSSLIDAKMASEGVAYSKMNASDKFISDLQSLLTAGYMHGVQAGEKSSYLILKGNSLDTYNSKKNSYQYIDNSAFIKTDNGNSIDGIDPNQELLKMLYPKLEGELKRISMITDEWDYYSTIQGFEKGKELSMFHDVLYSKKSKNKLKDYLTSKEFLDKLKTTSLIDILNDKENKTLKNRIDEEIIGYFDNLVARYDKNLYNKTFSTDVYNKQTVTSLPDFLKQFMLSQLDENQKKAVSSSPDLDIKLKDAALRSYAYNVWLHKSDLISLLYTDAFQFDHAKDASTKRIPTYQSTGRIFATDVLTQMYVNKFVGRGLEESLIESGKFTKTLRKYDGTFRSAIIKESKVRSEYFDMYRDLFKKNFEKNLKGDALKEALYGRDEKGVGSAEDVKGGVMKNYAAIEDGDGQGWISFDSYRILKRTENAWTIDQENAYQKIIKGESLTPDQMVDYFPVYKLQYAGQLNVEGRYPINSIHKFSLLPLIPTLVKDSPLETVHNEMMKQDIDYALFSSGAKQSYIKPSATSKGDKIFEENANGISDTSRLLDKIEFTPNPIYVSYLKNQTEINKQFKDASTFSTQLRKLLTTTLYHQGVPVDYKGSRERWNILSDKEKLENSKLHTLSERFNKRLDKLVKFKRKQLLKDLNWKEVPDKNGNLKLEGNPIDMITFITKEMIKQGYSKHEIEFIQTDSNIEVDLSLSPAAARLEKLLMSIINNRLVKLKLKGEAFVEVSAALNQKSKFQKPSKVDLETYGTNGLKSYIVDIDGKKNTKGMGIKIALTKNFENLFKTKYFVKNDKGEYVDSKQTIAVYNKIDQGKDEQGKPKKPKFELDHDASLVRLNEMLLVQEWLNIDSNRQKIRITGVRIPTQGPNSTEFAEVQQFLPASAGPIIIIPAEIVAKSGTDFDVDKMTTYIPHISKKGTLLEDKYNSEEEVDEAINKYKSLVKTLSAKKENLEGVINDKWLTLKEDLDGFRSAIKTASKHKNVGKDLYNTLTTRDNKKLLESLGNEETQKAVKNLFTEAYGIYESSIKGFKNKDYDQIDLDLKTLQDKGGPLYEAIKNLSDAKEQKHNLTGGIENGLINDIISILETPAMANAFLQPNDTHLVKPIADKLKGYLQKADDSTNFEYSIKTDEKIEGLGKGISPTRMLEEDYNNERQQNNIIGKGSLGIVAVDNYTNPLFNMAGAKMKKTMEVEAYLEGKTTKKPVQVPITLNIKHNKLDGVISLSNTLDADNINSVADVISQLMNGFVDVGKEAWVAYIQGNLETVPKLLFMLEAGVPIEEAVYLVSNPMTRQYVAEKGKRKSTLSTLIYGLDYKPELATSESKNNILQGIRLKSKDYSNNKTNVFGLTAGMNELLAKDPDLFSKDMLKSVATKRLNFDDDAQKAGFLQYLYIEQLIEEFNDFKKTNNPDTNTSMDLLTARSTSKDVEKLMKPNTLDESIPKYYKEKSPISSAYIQDFSVDLWSRMFKFRDTDPVNEFLYKKSKDKKVLREIKKKTGFDFKQYHTRYKNALALSVFSNVLRRYNPKKDSYRGVPISELINLPEIISDYTNNKFASEYTAQDSYFNRGLYPVPVIAVSSMSLNDFIEFSLAREFLRKENTAESLKALVKSKEFVQRRQRLIDSKIAMFNKSENETDDVFQKRINRITYENLLMNNALTNVYNNYQLFRSGENTTANQLMNIIENYSDDLSEYSVLDEFKPKSIQGEPTLKKVLNFQMINYKEFSKYPELVDEYNKQLKDLANSNVVKIKNDPYANKLVSDFFFRLPIVSFLQTGMDSSEFAMSSVMPYENYIKIMQSGANSFISDMNRKDPEYINNILNGFDKLFMQNYKTQNKKLRGRGLNWTKSIKDLIDLSKAQDYSVYDNPFLNETAEDSNIYVMNDSYMNNNSLITITDSYINNMIKSNPETTFIMSLKDLGVDFNVDTTEDLETAKQKIESAINEIKSKIPSGYSLVISNKIFDIAAMEKPQVSDKSDYTNHSGGAKGYDAEWDLIGKEFGMVNNKHYLLPSDGDVSDPRLKAKGVKPVDATSDVGEVALQGPATGEAQIAVTNAERAMGRIDPTHTTRNTKKIRNYAQVKNADGIFAIGSLIPKGADITVARGQATKKALVPQVNGGTSVAVQLGITMGKPTYVFNQVANATYPQGWYQWNASKQDFVSTNTPVLTKNFAGIGTSSNTTEIGKQAIKDVYENTFKTKEQVSKPKGEKVKPGIYVNQEALTKEEQLELFDLLKPYLEQQAAKTNKGENASKMIGLGLRWDYKSNNPGKTAMNIPDVINPGNKNKYGYYDQSINSKPLGQITSKFRKLMQKATGVDMTNYDGAIINLYETTSFITSHNDVDESRSAIKYPVIGINIGGTGNLSIESRDGNPKQLDLKAGAGYVFGFDGVNREVWHRTFPKAQDSFLPELTTKIDGKTYEPGSYRITITMRRVMPLESNMPVKPLMSSESTTENSSLNQELSLYLQQQFSDEFGVTSPSLIGIPSIKNMVMNEIQPSDTDIKEQQDNC